MIQKPEWQDAKSSMMRAFRFIDEKVIGEITFGRLEVTWSNGSTGAYLDVNRRTYDDFVKAESRGKFLNSQIKPNFKYVRAEDEAQESKEEPGIEA